MSKQNILIKGIDNMVKSNYPKINFIEYINIYKTTTYLIYW